MPGAWQPKLPSGQVDGRVIIAIFDAIMVSVEHPVEVGICKGSGNGAEKFVLILVTKAIYEL